MKVDLLFKKPGNSIVRVYKGARNAKRFCYTMSGAEFAFGAISARHKDIGNTTLFGLLSCWFLKNSKDLSDIQNILKPHYQKIVERTKQIKAAKK